MKKVLEKLYACYNKRQYVHPDPLEFVYRYYDASDREIAGLIASGLAYGRVAQILKSVSSVLESMSPSPSRYLEKRGDAPIRKDFASFKHRFTTGEELASMLVGIKGTIARHGSLERAFLLGARGKDFDINDALSSFVQMIKREADDPIGTLLPDPQKGSACKRINLYLRWMVRSDEVDPGVWSSVPPSKLIVPLDTHMFQIGRQMKFICRNQANMKAAVEMTESFRKINPADPVKYDFVLTRFGIRSELEKASLYESLGCKA